MRVRCNTRRERGAIAGSSDLKEPSMSETLSNGAVPPSSTRNLWLIGGALAIAGVAGAATMVMRAGPATGTTPAPTESLAQGESVVTEKPAAPVAKAPAKPVAARSPAEKVAAAPACANCGVVESVKAVTRKGDASGVGAVAGGVIGAVAGNQVGKGDGRKAMTVIGAIGGGLAGHEIEKRKNSVTVHEVRVKMDDGSVRTVEQAEAPKVGERVQIDGKSLKPAPAANG
jgi:outer membrane lipoprotein SlyB